MQLKSYCDHCSFSRLTFQMKYRIMQFHNMLDDSKSQSRTTGLFGSAFINTVKAFKHTLVVLFGDTDSRVGNFNKRMFIVITCYDFYRTVFTIVTDCIVTKIVDKFVNLITVSVYDGSFCIPYSKSYLPEKCGAEIHA